MLHPATQGGAGNAQGLGRTDQIGTPQAMTDAEGHVVWCVYYKAWGGLILGG
ncbi:RHS domain-containing protein [Pseudomonas sp. NFXW11]|uniref:RHS domain-containing protein n=1 Tax=Pseudomonas sp. NFXW11 TaxID=2819531 RepID=UPI003CF62A24